MGSAFPYLWVRFPTSVGSLQAGPNKGPVAWQQVEMPNGISSGLTSATGMWYAVLQLEDCSSSIFRRVTVTAGHLGTFRPGPGFW